MSEYWLISAPGEKTCQQTFDTMNNLTSKQNNLCNNYKFHIPDLKVGTLDQLVGLSDDLGKLDTYVEQITRKVATYLGEVLEDQRDKLHENLLANNSPGPPDMSSKACTGISSSLGNISDRRDKSAAIDFSACYSGSSPYLSSSGDRHQKRANELFAPPFNCNDCCTSTSIADTCSRDSSATATCTANEWYSASPVKNVQNYATSTLNDLHKYFDVTRAFNNSQLNNNNNNNNNNSNNNNNNICSIDNNRLECNSSNASNNKNGHVSSSKTSELGDNINVDDGGGGSGVASGVGGGVGAGAGSGIGDISETLDWWFHRQKRSARRSRSSPVSSCCGNNSQGRSSPEADLNESPTFPLSPADLSAYITRFQWDMAKYPIKQSLRNIADIISKQIGQIDADLKTKSNAYNSLKGSLQNLEKKQTGSLLTRNLADLVKKEHFILDSEYLTTLLVIVPKMMANDWLANYEKITDMIVPRSSTMIQQDQDFCLFNVTLFKKVVEEFKLHAREKKFIVRDFVYNEEELAAGKNEITKLLTDKKKQFGPLVRWLKVNFSEAFCALVHVKALRVFVESVLRYGLPVNFQAILIEPNKKSVKRLRECLNQLYGHLDGASAAGQAAGADNVDIPGLGFGQSEYYPYVFYKMNIDMVETAKI